MSKLRLIPFKLFTILLFSISFTLLLTTQVSAAVFISEFMPDPTGTDANKEWVELYNLSDSTVDISGWKIQSYSGDPPIDETISIQASRNKVVRDGVVISPNSYIVLTDLPNETGVLDSIAMFDATGTLNLLNNDAYIILRDQADQILDYLYYESSTSGRSWERSGPLCSDLVRGNPHTGLLQNSNHSLACWPEVIVPIEPTVYEGIQFSLDNLNWYDSLDVWGPARVYFRYVLSGGEPDFISAPTWRDIDGNTISSPTIFQNYSGSISLEIQINETAVVDDSFDIQVTLIDEALLVSSFQFSTDQVNWQDSIVALANTPVFASINFNYSDLQIDSIRLFDNQNNELPNPFQFSRYLGEIRAIINIAASEFEVESSVNEVFASLRINEFLPNPTGSNVAWVEIMNSNSFSVPIQFYSLNLGSLNFTLSGSNSGFNSCTEVTELQPEQICVYYFPEGEWLEVEGGTFQLNYKNQLVQSISYGQTLAGQSISYWEGVYTSDEMQVTAGLPNAKIVLNYTLIITELYAAPLSSAGEIEWLEIFNFGPDPIALSGVYLKDKGSSGHEYGTRTGYFPSVILNPNEYFVITQPELYVTLNNSGDTLTLFSPSGQILDSVIYNNARAGESHNRIFSNGVYTPVYSSTPIQIFPSTILTPGEQNEFPTEPGIGGSDELVLKNITDAEAQPNGSLVFTEGVVSVESNVLGSNVFYIQDSTGGIRIELGSGVYFNPYIGQRVRVIGTISEAYTERRIRVTSSDNIFTHNEQEIKFADGAVTVFNIPSLQDLESLEGVFVYIEGEIVAAYSTSFDVETSFGIIRVAILSSTGINISKSKGDQVYIYGILSQYNGVYRVLPRYQADILLIKPAVAPKLTAVKKSSTLSTKSKLSPTILSSSTMRLPQNTSLFLSDQIEIVPMLQSLIPNDVYSWPFWLIFFVTTSYILLVLNWRYIYTKAQGSFGQKEKFRFDDRLKGYYDSA